MDAKYILLIQRQFDQALSERETYELQGFLAGNEAASKLCENVRRLLEECENVDLPEQFKPVDGEHLLTEILSALSQRKSRSWFSFVKQFVQSKKTKPQIVSTHQDELAVLRKHRATADNTSKAMDALRAKVVAEVAPITSEDAVSLAEAIKRRMLTVQNETLQNETEASVENKASQNSWTATSPLFQSSAPPMVPPQFNNAPPPSISESMDQLFSSSNWPVITPETIRTAEEQRHQEEKQTGPVQSQEEHEFKTGPGPAPFASVLRNRFQQQQQQADQQQAEQLKQSQQAQPTATQQPTQEHREQSAPGQVVVNQNQSLEPEPWPTVKTDQWSTIEPEHMEPIWQLELEAREPDPIWPTQPTATQPDPIWPTQPATAPVHLRPASLIPVDDIIAHVSHMFSEHITDERQVASRPSAPTVVPAVEDPLGASSGQYPQIREMDLRKANAARLSTTPHTDESNGQIKALGNFLLDKHSAATIGNLSNAKANLAHARILSDEEALALQDCLSPIESLQGVAGCIILGYDGMIIMSSLPDHADKDALSAWALLTYMNTHDLVRVVGHSRLRQFVSRTLSGYLLLADFGQGLLLAVSDNASTEAILPLMKSVRRVTAA